uniref:papilin-like isoform X2 n=1 Tax=Dermacentor albipictus TaxID=60249 RepID=UPI0031FC1083
MRPLRGFLVLLISVNSVQAWFKKSPKLEKKQPPFCTKPPFLGSCRPLTQTWYYNSTEKRCTPSSAGVCIGGSNRFVSEKKCKETCESPSKATPSNTMCLKSPVTVSCGQVEHAWFFDPDSSTCKMFTYIASACGSVSNKFWTEMMCQAVCLPTKKPQITCSQDPVPDICFAQRKKWFFNYRNNTCMQFPKGCGKAANSFSTYEKCMGTCSSSLQKSFKFEKKQPLFCKKSPFLGSCRQLAQTWYYDSTEKRCKQLSVDFCNGGSNKFLSEKKCKDTCQSPTKTMPYMCFKPPVRVSCGRIERAWLFDPNTNICTMFFYTASTCENVGNKFRTEKMCQAACLRGQATATSPTSKQHPNELPSGVKPSVPGHFGHNVNPGQPAVPVSPSKPSEPPKDGQVSPVGSPGQPARPGLPNQTGPSQVQGPTSPVGPAARPSPTTLPIQSGLPQKPGQVSPVGPNGLPGKTNPLGPLIQSGLPQNQGLVSRFGPAGHFTMFTSPVPAGLPSKTTYVNQAGPSGGPALPGRRI